MVSRRAPHRVCHDERRAPRNRRGRLRATHRLLEKARLGDFAWSPDGRRLAYTGVGGTSVQIVRSCSAGGGKPRPLVRSVPSSVLPTWSSRGEIAFTSARTDRGHIYSISPDGGRPRILVRRAADSFPAWSPDGELLLFQRSECVRGSCGTALSVLRADGSRLRRLSSCPNHRHWRSGRHVVA